MKKLTALLLALAMVLALTACVTDIPEEPVPDPIPKPDPAPAPDPTPDPKPAPADPEPSGPIYTLEYVPVAFSEETMPRLDGSTATIPLSEGIVSALLGYTPAQATAYVHHNTTHNAYVNLVEGRCDLIFVTYPSADELQLLGDDFEVVRVVKDAFVFLTNKENPVDNLSLEQIRDIYRGKLTNWSQVGGADAPIIPYQRPVNSGSQTSFHRFILPPEETMEPPMTQIVADMGGLIDAVSTYDNSADALGYSVFYYANDMYTSEKSRLIAVDGVLPTAETISAEQYPLWDGYYAVFRKSEPAGSPVRQLMGWLLSESGQQVAVQQGYVHNGSGFLDPSLFAEESLLQPVKEAYWTIWDAGEQVKDSFAGAYILPDHKLQVRVAGADDQVLAKYREILKDHLDVVVFKEAEYSSAHMEQLCTLLKEKLPAGSWTSVRPEGLGTYIRVTAVGSTEALRSLCQADPALKDQPILFASEN